MLKIQIKDSAIEERRIKDLTLRSQVAWFSTEDGETRKFRVTLPRGRFEPYAPGMYTLAAASFEVGPYKDLTLGRDLALVPLAASGAAGLRAQAG